MGVGELDSAAGAKHTLTRRQVAERLGISTSVRRLEYLQLHPVMDERGVWRFDPAEVEAIAPRAAPPVPRPTPERGATRELARKGRLAAKVFRMFARHLTLPQIVVMTKQPPEVIRELYREWNTTLHDGEWERRQAGGRP